MELSWELNAGSLWICPTCSKAEEGVLRLYNSAKGFLPEGVSKEPPETAPLNKAEGPNSFDMFSKAPAACASVSVAGDGSKDAEPLPKEGKVLDAIEFRESCVDRALRIDSVVESNNGEVILRKPGANCAGVDEG